MKGIVTATQEQLIFCGIDSLKNGDEVIVKEKDKERFYAQKEEYMDYGMFSIPKGYVSIINEDAKKTKMLPQFSIVPMIAFGYDYQKIEDVIKIHNYYFLCFSFSYATKL